MSQEHALEFHQGEHWIVAVTFLDGDEAAIDLTGAVEVNWAISETRSSTVIHTATLANGEVFVVDAQQGRADISVPPSSQGNLTAGTYYHEARVTNAAGIVSVQFQGPLTIRHSILGTAP